MTEHPNFEPEVTCDICGWEGKGIDDHECQRKDMYKMIRKLQKELAEAYAKDERLRDAWGSISTPT